VRKTTVPYIIIVTFLHHRYIRLDEKNVIECCRQTFVYRWTAGTSRNLSLPCLTAAEFLLQTPRRGGTYWSG